MGKGDRMHADVLCSVRDYGMDICAGVAYRWNMACAGGLCGNGYSGVFLCSRIDGIWRVSISRLFAPVTLPMYRQMTILIKAPCVFTVLPPSMHLLI